MFSRTTGIAVKRLLFLVILVVSLDLTTEEIHRARGIKPPKLSTRKFTPRSTWPPGPNRGDYPTLSVDGEGELEDDIGLNVEKHSRERHSNEAWIYSIISSCLVGLSGIFPLIVIPLEAGEALKHGAPAARLKLLLSFAVGSLLGDVFLHLLPEAWQNLQVDDHRSHTHVGLWVMGGMLVFLIIEKMFPDEEEDSVEAQEDTTPESDCLYQRTGLQTDHKVDKDSAVCNGDSVSSDLCGEQNGELLHCHNGGCDSHSTATKALVASQHTEKSHIKISGWLNLMANVVDNFTHGLAVAGSYCVSTKVGLLTTFAILLHEIPHEVGDFAILLRSGFDRWKAARAQIVTASGGMIGALCALTANSVQEAGDMTAWILPFTAGGFIYIALVTCVPDLMTEKDPWESMKQVFLMCCGIGVMVIVTLLG